MAKLPTALDLSGPGSFRSGRQYFSADASAAGRGLAAFGADLSAIGAERKQQENTVDIARAEAYKTKGLMEKQNAFDNDPDYATYESRAPKETGDVVKKAGELIRDPKMRERWLIGAGTDAARVNDGIFDKGTQVKRSAETIAFDDALETNRRIYVDPETPEPLRKKAKADIEGAIKAGQESGLLDPVDADKRRTQFIEEADFSRAKLAIDKDPSKFIAFSGDVDGDPVVAAIENVESSENPQAYSAKGAVGLMQVMPETGAEIAGELGDSNFPAGGTKAEQEAYLANPQVSRAYGSYYYNKMLKQYGGDTEAALIAYNGGAARADAWLKAGRDDSVIPSESAAYYKKVLSRVSKPIPLSQVDVNGARQFLKSKTNKGAASIDGMDDGFAVKVSRMFQAAPPEIRAGLGIYSGYRSVERQTELWNAAVKKYGSVSAARKWVAPPPGVEGSTGSQHNHGKAADLGYNGQSLKNAPPHVVKWLHDNAGQYGLKFPLSNENWHIEDSGTRGGHKSAMPDYVGNLSPENRAALADYQDQKVKAWQTQQAANQKAMNGAAYDDFSLRIATGDMNLNQREILSSDIIDNGQKATLINSLNTKMKEIGETAAAVQAFAAGGLSVDPYDGKGKDAVDNVYAATTKDLAPEQVQPITEEIVRQSKTVPKQALSLIRQGLTSNDPLQIEKAAQAAQRISAIDPGALSRRDGGSEVQKVADDFSYYVNKLNMSPSDAAKRIQADNDPAKVVERKAIEPAAKQFVKSLESFDIANEFDPDPLGAQPALGTTPAQALGIQAEFIAIAEDQFFKANGDPELAKNRAVEQMKRLYGPSEFGVEGNKFNMAGQAKSVLMKHPPEMYWPKEGGSLQYARTKLWQDVTGIDPEYQEGSIQLVTTPETDAMIKRGEMPAYGILWKDKDGVMQTMPGKLWRPDIEMVTNRMSKKAAEEKAVIIDRAKQTDADIKDGRDRMGSLDNFLGVTPDNFLSGGAN